MDWDRALDTTVINTGSPSVALDWRLSIIPKIGAPKLAQLTTIPTSLVARGKLNTSNISSSESLDVSALSEALQTNVPRSGKLLFYVALPKEQVEGAVFELTVKDVKGRSFLIRKDTKEWLSR